MPALDNPKHETFAKHLALGKTQIAAYRLAGYSGSASNASTLAREAAVKARVLELRAEAKGTLAGIEAARHLALTEAREKSPGITHDWLTRELMRVLDAAREAGDYDAALKSIELGARLIGIPIKDKDIGARASQIPNGSSSQPGNSGALAALNRLAERMGDGGGNDAPARDQPAGEAQPVPVPDHGSNGAAKPVGGGDRAARPSGAGIPSPTEIGSFE